MTSLIRYAAAALAAAGFALAQQAATPAATPAPGIAPPALGGWAVNQTLRIGAAFDLSLEQKAQVQAILEDRRSQLLPLLPQIGENRDAIQQLTEGGATGEAFDKQLQTLAGAQGSLLSQMAVVRAKATARIWAVLTPAQRLKVPPFRALLDPEGSQGPGAPGARPRYRRPTRPVQPQ